MLTSNDIARYSRHILLPEFGLEGQEKMKVSSVLIVGAGGLGSPLAMYLAAAGVGRIGIVEFDVVDESNLQRQIIYSQADVGRLKIEAAVERLESLNPLIEIEPHAVRITRENALDIVSQYDVVADGTDNFATRYLINDACVLTGRPNVYASIFKFDGQVSIFGAEGGPCYRCLYPEPPPAGLVPSCAEGGVLGVLPGIVGSIQAAEVIKLIAGIGDPLIGKLLLFDALSMHFKKLALAKDPECPVCSDTPTQKELIDYEEFCGPRVASDDAESNTGAGQNQKRETRLNSFKQLPEYTPIELKNRLENNPDLVILDVRMPVEYKMCNLGGTLLPLQELENRVSELESFKNSEVVVMCRSGARSAQAQSFLDQNGFTNVFNLAGGILAWSDTVDSSVRKY